MKVGDLEVRTDVVTRRPGGVEREARTDLVTGRLGSVGNVKMINNPD